MLVLFLNALLILERSRESSDANVGLTASDANHPNAHPKYAHQKLTTFQMTY